MTEVVGPKVMTVMHGWAVLDPSGGGILVAVCPRPELAARIAQLWERHGLCDVPDTIAEVQP